MIAVFLIVIGAALLAFAVPALVKGLRMSRKGDNGYYTSQAIDGLIMSGVIGSFAGLLPLALGIIQLFTH